MNNNKSNVSTNDRLASFPMFMMTLQYIKIY